jgi:hypothetical protein
LAGGYRFVCVRHSDYPPLDARPIDFGTRELVHAHLPNAAASATFQIPVRAGEELALKLSATREEARAEARRGALSIDAMALRLSSMSEPGMAAAGEGGDEMGMGMSMEGSGKSRRAGVPATQYQSFLFEVFQDGARLTPASNYQRLRASHTGVLEVRVRAGNSVGGGLFDLAVERDLQLMRVHGVVVDSEDRPLSGVQLHFLREPDGDLLAVAQSDARGAFEASMVPARLSIQMMRNDRAARESVRVELSEPTEINLVFVPGARRR